MNIKLNTQLNEYVTCDVVYRVEGSRVVHVHSEQQHSNNCYCDQQIDWHRKGPISTPGKIPQLMVNRSANVGHVFPESYTQFHSQE